MPSPLLTDLDVSLAAVQVALFGWSGKEGVQVCRHSGQSGERSYTGRPSAARFLSMCSNVFSTMVSHFLWNSSLPPTFFSQPSEIRRVTSSLAETGDPTPKIT